MYTLDATLPGDDLEVLRRQEAARRLILLEGDPRPLYADQMERRFSSSEINEMGDPSAARNMARYVAREASALYWQRPIAACEGDPDGGVADTIASPDVGWWELSKRNQRRAFLLRESVARVGMVERPRVGWVPQIRMVSPALLYCEASPDEPRQPTLVVENRLRRVTWENSTKTRQCWDILDVRDPDHPVYRVVIADGSQATKALDGAALDKLDVTAQVLGTDGPMRDGGYPFRWADGLPYVPYRVYHVEEHGSLWDPYCGSEMVEATLDQSMLLTFFQHLMMRASWDQRVLIDGTVRGLGTPETKETKTVAGAPTRVLQIKSDPDAPSPAKIDSWGPAGDPYAMYGAVSEFEAANMGQSGVSPSADFQQSAKTRSGIAIKLSREAVRELQREQEPQFRASDQAVLAMVANQMRTRGGRGDIGEACEAPGNWSIDYPGLPLSAAERDARADEIKALTDLGVEPSRVWKIERALRVSRQRALELVEQWDADNRTDRAASLEQQAQRLRADG